MDWEVTTKSNKRKQRKDEKKNAGRTKAKPDAILIRKKYPNTTFASVLKLIKDKVDKKQVAENVNKIRQTKTGGVVQLQLSQQVALDVRDMDMDRTKGEVQKALAETTGVHRYGSAKCTALAKTKERRLRKGNG